MNRVNNPETVTAPRKAKKQRKTQRAALLSNPSLPPSFHPAFFTWTVLCSFIAPEVSTIARSAYRTGVHPRTRKPDARFLEKITPRAIGSPDRVPACAGRCQVPQQGGLSAG